MRYPVRNRALPFLNKVLFFIGLPSAIICLIMLRSGVTSMEYRIGSLERQKVQAMTERKTLEADISSLKARAKVDQTELALADPDRRKVFIVKRDNSATPQAAAFKR